MDFTSHICKTDLTTVHPNHRQRTSAYKDTNPNQFHGTNSPDKNLQVGCGFNNDFKMFVFRKQEWEDKEGRTRYLILDSTLK